MRRQRVERGGVGDLPAIKAYAFAGIGIDDQALLAVVHAERARGAAFVDKLHAEKTRRIGRPLVDIAGADPNIAERLHAHVIRSRRIGEFCGIELQKSHPPETSSPASSSTYAV